MDPTVSEYVGRCIDMCAGGTLISGNAGRLLRLGQGDGLGQVPEAM